MSRSPRLAFAGLVAVALVAIAACGSSTSSGGVAGATGTPAASTALSAPASAPASAAPSGSGLNQKLVDIKAVNGSNITGGGILTDLGNNQTAVTIGVVAAGVKDPMPANLAPGSCATMASGSPAPSAGASGAASAAPSAAASAAASGSAGASASAAASASPIPLNPGDTAKLGDLSAGASNTVINIALNDLASQPYAIVIYKSAADMTVVACGDLT